MNLLVSASIVAMGIISCKTAKPREENSAALLATNKGQGCVFADGIWSKVLQEKYLNNANTLPKLKGEFHTSFSILADSHIAMKTFLKEQNALDGEEISVDEDGKPSRPKAIHALGTVARIKFVANKEITHPYTGLYKSGADCGLIRVSLAVKPGSDGITPGAAVKFYLDPPATPGFEQPRSLNIHVMHQLDPLPELNVLNRPFSNVLPPPKSVQLKLGAKYFQYALTRLKAKDTFGGHLTVDHLAEYESNGRQIAQPVAPYRITLVPTVAARKIMSQANAAADFRIELPRFEEGGALFDIYADETTQFHATPYGVKIGSIVTTSEFVSSKYADEILHFAHHTATK